MPKSETIIQSPQQVSRSPFVEALRAEIIDEYRQTQADEETRFRRALEEIAEYGPDGSPLDRRRVIVNMGNIARRALNLSTLH